MNEEYKVWTTEEYQGLPEGTCLNVTRETKDTYFGIIALDGASGEWDMPKEICTKESPLETLFSELDKVKETPEIKEMREKLLKSIEETRERN